MARRLYPLPACSLVTVLLACFAAVGNAQTLVPNPGTVTFDPQSVGTASPARTVTLTNAGPGGLTITSIATPAGFTTSHNCGALAQGASCAAQLVFNPDSPIAFGGSLAISGTMPAVSVPLTGSGEFSLVAHYYRSILGRLPDAGGKAYWTAEAGRLQAGGANLSETWFAMSASFFFSPEYRAFNRSDAAFITDLYTTFFNRAPDAGGLAYWTGQLQQGMPREVLLTSFTFSPEFGTFTQGIFGNRPVRPEIDTVTDFYRGLLSRLPDQGGLDYWVQQFQAAQCTGAGAVYASAEAISSAFSNGAEYASRGRTNAQFVGDLYNAFLRRGGDLAGVQYWINELATGKRTREKVRQDFIASAEFTGRVNAIVAQGCLPAGKPLSTGSFIYLGTRPPLGRVDVIGRDGVAFGEDKAHQGWVQLRVIPAQFDAAMAAVNAAGGAVLAKSPGFGALLVQVTPGTEKAFLQSVYSAASILDGTSAPPVRPGMRSWALDWNSAGGGACLTYHGTITSGLASSRGDAFALYSPGLTSPTNFDIADFLARQADLVPAGERQVVNISVAYDLAPGRTLANSVTPSCNINCVTLSAAINQFRFHAAIFDVMEQLSLTRPDLADRTLVTLIAGNTGVALDTQLAALKNTFPNAFKRIVIVGATDSARNIQTSMNYAANNAAGNMVYARGVSVPVNTPATGSIPCTGTSYAAPQVAALLNEVWKLDPSKTSAQVLTALRAALAARGTTVIPQDANGVIDPAFVAEVKNQLSPPLPACNYVYSAWSSCVNGQQTRSVVAASPAGCTGAPVVTQPCSANACCACNFDVFCTVFGLGGCWRCQNSTYNSSGICGASGLVSSGSCRCDPALFETCS